MRITRAVVLFALIGAATPALAQGDDRRGHAAGKFMLAVGNNDAGWIHSAEGGHASAEVVTERGGDLVPRKHLANVKYTDISITTGPAMSNEFYAWITEALSPGQGENARRSGVIIQVDDAGNEVSRLEFYDALIVELGLPALDARSRQPARLTIKLRPEATRRVIDHCGQRVRGPRPPPQNAWRVDQFRLRIDGLEEATARVSKVDALTIKQTVAKNANGGEQQSTAVEVPNLAITLAEAHAFTGPLADWEQSFLIEGNNDDSQEKNGLLEYLAVDGKPLFTLTLRRVGLFQMGPDKTEDGEENTPRVKAEMYCEEMSFSAGSK